MSDLFLVGVLTTIPLALEVLGKPVEQSADLHGWKARLMLLDYSGRRNQFLSLDGAPRSCH